VPTVTPPSSTAAVRIDEPWAERSYEPGTYGADETHGVAATWAAEAMTLRVVPVRYEAADGRERIASLVDDLEMAWRDPTTFVPDVPRQVAFAVVADYQPVGGSQRAVFTVTGDAGDAVAAAVWLIDGSPDPGALHRNVRLHRGDPVSRTHVTVADDDALTALFADEPNRCVFTGNPTRSHHITVPYRYAPLLEGFRQTDRGLPRVPSTVVALVGAVSHGAWTDRDLATIDWDTQLDRVGPGEYRLDEAVVTSLDGAAADAFTLHRLGPQ